MLRNATLCLVVLLAAGCDASARLEIVSEHGVCQLGTVALDDGRNAFNTSCPIVENVALQQKVETIEVNLTARIEYLEAKIEQLINLVMPSPPMPPMPPAPPTSPPPPPPSTPSSWKIALFFEGYHKQVSANDIIDSTPYSHAASAYTGAPEILTSNYAAHYQSTGSLKLDGSQIVWAGANEFLFGASDFAVDGDWYSTQNSGEYKGLFSIGANVSPGNDRIELAIHSGRLQVYTAIGDWRDTSYTPPLNTWFHVRLQRQDGTMQLLIDGVSKWSVSNSRNYAGDELPELRLGTHVTDFNGAVDNFIISVG